jgi:hypothetical protein
LKLFALSAAVVLLSIHAVAFTNVRETVAQSPNRVPLLVEIVNTAEDPVPVSLDGASEVSGNVNATQAGNWTVDATQSGEWSMNSTQAGDWTVGIDPNAYLIQLDGNEFANRELFHGHLALIWGDSFEASETFTVPEGKLLVIEQISAHAITSDRMDMVILRSPPFTTFGPFWSTDDILTYRLLMTRGDHRDYVGADQTTIYVEGGQDVLVHASRDSNSESGQNQVFVTLTGYMVDLP